MKGPPSDFWGKLRGSGGELEWHPLADHCADVAACAEALLRETLLGERLATLAGVERWSEEQIARLCVFAALHDVGKFNLGFQARWRAPEARGRIGHVGPVVALFGANGEETQSRFVDAVGFSTLASWAESPEGAERLLLASVCHHGRPYSPDTETMLDRRLWKPADGLDPMEGIRRLGAECRTWFPAAFSSSGTPLPDLPKLQHALCGLVTLADWLGSDDRRFRFRESGDSDRMSFARSTARESFRDLGLAASTPRARLPAGAPLFSAVTPHKPRAAQVEVARLPISGDTALTILEAETGSGKTEAALFHFLRLFHAAKVDGMYFALPTRTAATEIHRRVDAAARTMFQHEPTRPPVVLAVPGYYRVDDREVTQQLAPFEFLWNDSDKERWRFRGWAAENSKRYLAGAISVGTIDQALLSALAVPHSHMRTVALFRQLLVVDEVHASDTYMTRVLEKVLKRHLESGGHALLLSATLGAAARDAFLRCADPQHPKLSFDDARSKRYPAISWTGPTRRGALKAVPGTAVAKRTTLMLEPVALEPEKVAALALRSAREGGRVLVLRNTVRDAMATQRALESAAAIEGAESLLFRCAGLAAPYHARFAREDRLALDKALLEALGRGPRDSGMVIVATQTAQQSLDIDADLLLTDLCPADVLLQRLGRLHRHAGRSRPAACASPRAHVLVPAVRDLSPFLGAGGDASGPCGLGTVYEDLRTLEATWRLIETAGTVEVPTDSRSWVERTTHPEALAELVSGLGGAWTDHHASVVGRRAAQRAIADHQLARWCQVFGSRESLFPGEELDRRIATRLGVSDRRALFPRRVRGAFDTSVAELSIPGRWMYDVPDDALPDAIVEENGELRFQIAVRTFQYTRLGLERTGV